MGASSDALQEGLRQVAAELVTNSLLHQKVIFRRKERNFLKRSLPFVSFTKQDLANLESIVKLNMKTKFARTLVTVQ